MFYFMRKCKECAHWQEQPMLNDLTRVGFCKRMPPQVVVLPASNGYAISTAYPTIQDNHEACSRIDLQLVTDVPPEKQLESLDS